MPRGAACLHGEANCPELHAQGIEVQEVQARRGRGGHTIVKKMEMTTMEARSARDVLGVPRTRREREGLTGARRPLVSDMLRAPDDGNVFGQRDFGLQLTSSYVSLLKGGVSTNRLTLTLT